MKKIIQALLNAAFLMMYSGMLFCGPVFTVTPPVIQNMVAGSSQNLSYTLANAGTGTVNVHCSFTSDNPNVSFSFNNSGCTTSGGVGLPAKPNTLSVLLTLNSRSGASGTVHGRLVFQQTNGRGPLPPPQILPMTIEIQSNSNRTIVFQNYCPFSVYFGMTAGNAPAANIGTIACTKDSDCSAYTFSSCVNGACGGGACNQDSDCAQHYPANYTGTCAQPAAGKPSSCSLCYGDNDCIAGTRCNTSNHLCYWETPAPADTNYELTAYTGSHPAQNTVHLNDNSASNGYTLVWTGRAAGRTGCTFLGSAGSGYYSCRTASCNGVGGGIVGDGYGGCGIAQSFDAPSTLLEFALVALTPDTYDVSMVNGLTIPATMQPAVSKDGPQAYGNPFTCGTAGGITQTNTSGGNLGACSWSFSPPSVAFRLVTAGLPITACSHDSDCTGVNSNWRCGQTYANVSSTTTTASLSCGLPLGYWNQNELCVASGQTAGVPNYNVDHIVSCPANAGGGNTVFNLLQGTGNAGTSCYNVAAPNNTCGGCTNWQNQGLIMPSNNNIVQQCQYPNSFWGAGRYPNETGAVLPGILWLKRGCPSGYSYVYDDKASTFGCPANNGQSAMNYVITFCPGGKTAGSTGG